MTESKQNGTPIKGAEIAIKTLEKLGVDIVFAYPGGAAIEFHQALKDSPIRVILPRNEQGGAFAADGYARVTGKTGVCMATSGPGATNLLTGIADAYMDSIPMVIITGQVAANFIGKNAFQETDIIGMTRPIVKHSYLVLDEKDIVSTIVNAFYLANSGRPGPVLIDIPKNVQQKKLPFVFSDRPSLTAYELPPAPEKKEIEAIRAREAKEEEARRAEMREAEAARQKAEEEARAQQEAELKALREKQEAEDKALLEAKREREKQLERDRKERLKQAEAERKAKLKAQKQLLKEKERARKEKLKQAEAERKAKEKARKAELKAKEAARKAELKAKEKAREEARKAKEAAARGK